MDYVALAEHCAPQLDPSLVVRLVRRESSLNAFAIGLDGKAGIRDQPRNYEEAVRLAEQLISRGTTFSAGIGQLHISNIRRFGMTWRQVFHPCTNLSYAQTVFLYFHGRAIAAGYRGDNAVFSALRGYNSGNVHATVSNDYAAAILGRRVSATSQATAAPPVRSQHSESLLASGEAVDFFDQ